MALFLMPEQTARHLEDRIRPLSGQIKIRMQRARDLNVQIVFTEEERRDFAVDPAEAVMIAVDDVDQFTSHIPEWEEDRRLHSRVHNSTVEARFDPFAEPAA